MTSLSPEERETVATTSDGDPWVHVETFQRRYMAKLRNHPSFEVLVDDPGYVRARIKSSMWNPVTGAKRARNYTPEQKAAAADRMAAARAGKAAK